MQQFFDPARVVHHPHLSLAGGAIRGWDRRNAYYFALMQSLAKHYKFDVEQPWQELPAKHQKVVLYGSGEDKIDFRYVDAKGGTIRRAHKWEGVIPNLERRYRETESIAVREELAKYLSNQPCPDCGGTRLNRAARNVFVAETDPAGTVAARRSATRCASAASSSSPAGAARSPPRSSRRSASACAS